MEYVSFGVNNIFERALVLFSDDEEIGVDTDELEDGDSLDELSGVESDDDPGVEWRSDAEYEE